MHGFGAVVAEKDEPVFHAPWEGRVRAFTRATLGRYYNLDEFRFAIERMPAAAYLEASYYEKWLHAVETLLVEKGVVTPAELASGQVQSALPPALPRDSAAGRPPLTPRFASGDAVITRVMSPRGHTRLARYARGKRGVVRSVNGPFLLPDTNAHQLGEVWEPVYAVEFTAREPAGDHVICLDCWESYLRKPE
jgi:nitrile hydratase